MRNNSKLEIEKLKCGIRKYSLISFFISYCFFPSFCLAQANSEEDVIKNAKELFSEGEYAAALPLYSQLLSLYPKDPNYSYRFGACKLFSEKDKEAPLTYLEFAVNDPVVEPEAFFFLGKAYHLNYRFDEALTQYKKFDEKGDSDSKEKLFLQRHIAMCENGKKLLKNVSDLVVLEKKNLSKEDFFRNYDLNEFGGKIIKTPDEFKQPYDLKKKKESIMYLQPNADVVYFSSYGEDGKNGKDIYFAKKTPDGNWGTPQKLLGPVNTEFDEDYAFIHPNGKDLFFSSTGHNSMGGYDIFKSEFDEASQQWGYPQNVDFAICTPGDDYLYITDMDEKNAYFSSTRESNQNEVTVYRVRVERIPVDIAIIKGIFIADTKSAKITIEDLKDGKVTGVYNTNANTGDYVLTVPNGGKFKFLVETAGSSVTYSGMVDVPRQKTLKAMKQEMQLVADNGEQQLIIKNIFDEEATEEVSVLLAEIYKEKASLEVNVNEVKEEKPEEKTEPVAETKTDSVQPETTTETRPTLTIKEENISNDEIVKIAKEDAKNAQKEASDLKLETEIAYAIANEKNRVSAEKSKEAEEQMTAAMYSTSDPTEKQQKLDKAKQLKKESKLYAEQAVAAFNLGREIEKVATEKQKEADIAFNYAQELENAAQQNTPEATAAKLAELNESLQKQRSETPKTAYADFQKQIEEKRKESEIQTKLAQKLQDDVKNLEADVSTLKTAAAAEKKKKDRERLEEQASILERDLPAMQSEAQTAKENAEKTQKELLDLEKQESIVSSVVNQIKSSDKTSVTSLNESDKSKLETEISSSEERIVKLSEELAADTGKAEEPLISIVNKEEQKTPSADTGSSSVTTSGNEATTEVPADYENYYKQKIEAAENFYSSDETVKKEELKATEYESWAKAQEKESADLKQKAEATPDVTEKTTLLEKATALENSASEKRKLSQESQTKVVQLKSEKTSSTEETAEQIPADYENYFKQKNEMNETESDAVKKEENKTKHYESWAKAQEKEAADLKQKAETTTDETEKSALIEKATALENSASEKRKVSQESQANAAQLRLNKPVSEQPTPSANLTEEQKQSIAAYADKYISTEKDAMNIQNEKDKNVTLAEINKEWADEISKEVNSLKASEDTITDETEKSKRKETIRLLEELKKEKESKANSYAEKAIETAPVAAEKSAPAVVVNEAEIPSDYNFYFENKIKEQEEKKVANSNGTNSQRELIVADESKAIYYESWANSIDKEIQKLKSELATISNEEEKKSAEEKIVQLETESKAKRDLAVQSNEQAKQLRQASGISTPSSETNISTAQPNETKEVSISELPPSAQQMAAQMEASKVKQMLMGEKKYRVESYNNMIKAIESSTENSKSLMEISNLESQKKDLQKRVEILNSEIAEDESSIGQEDTVNPINKTVDEKLTTSVVANQEADSLQKEAVYLDYQANEMGFFKRKKKEELKQKAKNVQRESELKKQQSDLANQEASSLMSVKEETRSAYESNSQLPSEKDLKKAGDAENEAAYLTDQANATRQNALTAKKKKEKKRLNAEADSLEHLAKMKKIEAEYFRISAEEMKKLEREVFIDLIAQAEKKDERLPLSEVELSEEEINSLKENEEQIKFSALRKDYKKLYFEAEISNEESMKMKRTSDTKLSQFSTMTSGIDTIPDAEARKQIVKDAMDFLEQTKKDIMKSDSIALTGLLKEETARKKLRDAMLSLVEGDKVQMKKIFAFQYYKPPVDSSKLLAQMDTMPKDTIPKEPEPPAIQEAFTVGASAATYDEKNPIPLNPKYPDGLVWQVQIGAFRNPIPQNLFKGFAPIMGVKVSDGITRYSAGMFQTFAPANSARNEIVKLGYEDAFVVAYRNGQRISITEARKLIAQGLITEGKSVISDISSTPETTVSAANFSPNASFNENSVASISGLFYTVQIGVYSKPAGDKQLKNVKPVNSENLNNGTIRYSSGVYKNFNEAAAAKNKIFELGIKDAFVTAYYNGKRISIIEAFRLSGSSSNDNQQRTTNNEQQTTNETGIVFKVQLGKYNGDVPTEIAGIILDLSRNNGKVVKENDGSAIYYSGSFKKFADAETFKNNAVNKGLMDASVVAFNNEEKMDLEEAKKSSE